MLRIVCLASLAALNDAYYWTPSRFDWAFYDATPQYYEPTNAPRWSISPDAYELKVRVPELEPNSMRAALASDGTKIEIVGNRKIEGCTCSPSTVKEVPLPYRPRVEDIDVSLEESVLSLRLSRHAFHAKADTATPLKVTTRSQDDKEAAADEAEERRPLRFVPHASAAEPSSTSPTSLQEQERTLTDKFRTAALAAVAVQQKETQPASAETSAKEAAATTAEGAVAAEVNSPPSAA